ncbi:MAG: indole-3-glycerol phosphate synthase TrpC [Caulobacterales bacterium]|nr:indole-3-glycerol phosphate synthase TrpC [Caulobacterales bacterium]
MTDILERIATYKRDDVAARKAAPEWSDIDRQALEAPPVRGFRKMLEAGWTRTGRPALIAEIKKASPSKGLIRADFNPRELAQAYERGGASCLSVLTDAPSFQGDDTYLGEARNAVRLPCIRKDFLVDPWQVAESRALGADCILIILAISHDGLAEALMAEARRFGMDVLVETHDVAEMEWAGQLGADLVGVNNRSLRTFDVDLALTEHLAPLVPKGALLIAESGISSPADVARVQAAGAQAILVGESLMRQSDVEAATQALLS